MPHYASVFWKSKYKTAKQKGYQGTDYKVPYKTKALARKAAQQKIVSMKKSNPHSKHLIFSAHVVTTKK